MNNIFKGIAILEIDGDKAFSLRDAFRTADHKNAVPDWIYAVGNGCL